MFGKTKAKNVDKETIAQLSHLSERGREVVVMAGRQRVGRGSQRLSVAWLSGGPVCVRACAPKCADGDMAGGDATDRAVA